MTLNRQSGKRAYRVGWIMLLGAAAIVLSGSGQAAGNGAVGGGCGTFESCASTTPWTAITARPLGGDSRGVQHALPIGPTVPGGLKATVGLPFAVVEWKLGRVGDDVSRLWSAVVGLCLMFIAHGVLVHRGLAHRLAAVEVGAAECFYEVASRPREPLAGGTGGGPTQRGGPAARSSSGMVPDAKLGATPLQTARYIVSLAGRVGWLTRKPALPAGPWSVGLASVTGPVRPSNQDFALAFQVGDDVTVMAVADGLGGLPHGERAARWATVRAAITALGLYGRDSTGHRLRPGDVAREAVRIAAKRVAEEAAALGIEGPRAGFRTTLIVVAATPTEFGYCYIGDGGLALLRRGATERLLEPQKADGAPNVLSASLGPEMEGSPVCGTARREPGDLLLVGTDGVWDRVGPEFPADVLRACLDREGDLQGVAEDVLRDLGTFSDAAGPICDDNMTLVLVGDGRCPSSTAEIQHTAQHDAVSSGGGQRAEEGIYS